MASSSDLLALALSHHQAGRLAEAEQLCRQILAAEPDDAQALNLMGVIAHQAGRPEIALAYFQRSVVLMPDLLDAHNNLGLVFRDQKKFEDAITSFNRALGLEPDAAVPRFNRSAILLLLGDFEHGWPEYEWRWKTGQIPARESDRPRWNGEALHGRTILLHTEQGLGDAIQFVRFVALVKTQGATVIVGCRKPLVKLLASYRGIDQLIGEGEMLPAFDVQAPLLSLPAVFKTTLDTIPASVPYLFADPALIGMWQEKLANERGFRIGINWHGRQNQLDSRRRDIPIHCFGMLAEVPGVQLVSHQKGVGCEELSRAALPIIDLGEDVDTVHGAFMDTAAIMMNLDLVITSDTSIPHLAGALGVPVWLALPFAPDWRWMLDRSDSPWYPTMRLFRQKSPGDWGSVFEEIKAALCAMITPR